MKTVKSQKEKKKNLQIQINWHVLWSAMSKLFSKLRGSLFPSVLDETNHVCIDHNNFQWTK